MFFQLARKGNNSLTSYLATIAVVFIGYFVGQLPLGVVIYWRISVDDDLGPDDLDAFFANPDFGTLGLNSNVGFFLLILMFVVAFAGLWLMVQTVHRKRMMDLVSGLNHIRWKRVFFGFWFWMLLGAVIEMISYLMNPDVYQFRFSGSSFVVLLLISLVLLPIQTSFEEVFFRGYLMQGLGLIFRKKLGPLLTTSLLFALIHGLNPEVNQFGMVPMMSYYICAGLILGIMTIMDDSLELALGVHAAVNVYGAVLVGYQGSAIQTDSLFKTSILNPWIMLIALIFMGTIFLIACSRKYDWPSFRRLFENIEIVSNSNDLNTDEPV